MADRRNRGDCGTEDSISGLIAAVRSGSRGRVVALLRISEVAEVDDELVRHIETVSRMVVLTGASLERLDEVRGRFTRPGRVRIEHDAHVAIAVARAAVGVGDLLLAVSCRTGVRGEVMRTPLGAARRSA